MVIRVIILRTFFVSLAPRVPIEEAVIRKTLGMREEAPTTGTERETAWLLCFLLLHFYVSLCKIVFTFIVIMPCHVLSVLCAVNVCDICFCPNL